MKVKFNHELKIGTSRVFEAISLMVALLKPHEHDNAIDLTPYDDIVTHHQNFIDTYAPHAIFHYSWLEFAIPVAERDSVQKFFKALELLPQALQLVTFLGAEIDENDAKEALKNITAMENCFKDLRIDPVMALQIFNFHEVIEGFKSFVFEIDAHPEFNRVLEAIKASGQYDVIIQSFQEGMRYRHPLSFAQEEMGKPFWNIADYKTYEFIVTYFLSPYKLRLMNGEKMIYVHSLIRKNKGAHINPDALSERFKIIGDATRLKILQMLYMKPMYGKEIADVLGLTTATVSHHLDALRQQGLINMEQVKQIKYFSTNFLTIKKINLDLMQFIKNDAAK
ncbi:ArsR/SmtB family transcription factor [Fusibacter bizertensis]